MKQPKRLVVRGRQRQKVDPHLLVQVLLAIGRQWDGPNAATREGAGVDAFDSAVEDSEVEP